MNFKVKNNKLIISDTLLPHKREIVIKSKGRFGKSVRNTKLSDVLTEMPHGIVFKDETGIGATTLELIAERNSIIVEPIRITAFSKVNNYNKFYTTETDRRALYVGSPVGDNQKKIIRQSEIENYHQDLNIKYKKIVVVADSLKKVIDAIGTEVNNYFLLIDEIDSFQLDSTYRRSMEECLDYYKDKFVPEKRAMVTATIMEFTDPKLKDEFLTIIKYDVPSRRGIDIINTASKYLLPKAYDMIVEKLNNFPGDKIMVAYNSVNGCYQLAQHLVENGVSAVEQISILCSEVSKDRVGVYFKRLLEDEVLPSKLNFITSAFFTGFDLNEPFHLISISGNLKKAQALSDKRLKQIAGRCRYGLLSETIIHDVIISHLKNDNSKAEISTEGDLELPTKEDLIETATEQVLSLVCMNKHYNRNPILQRILEDVNDKFLRILDDKHARFVRKLNDNSFQISYLIIDAELESNRIRKELYTKYDSLTNKLKEEGHNVNVLKRNTETEILDLKVSQHSKDQELMAIISKLKQINKPLDLKALLATKGSQKLTSFQKNIVKDFENIYGYLDKDDTLSKMQECLLGQRDNRRYNSFLISAYIQTLPEGHIIVDRLNYYFKIGNKYSPSEILIRLNLFLTETRNNKKVETSRKATRLLNNLRKTFRKKSDEDGIIYYHIKNANPVNLIVLKHRIALDQDQEITKLFGL